MTNALVKIMKAASLTLAISATSPAIADNNMQISPLQARTISMTDYTAVVYYTQHNNGDYLIVTSVGPNIGVAGKVLQHRVTIKPGQSYEFSMSSGKTGGPINTIKFTTCDEGLIVAEL